MAAELSSQSLSLLLLYDYMRRWMYLGGMQPPNCIANDLYIIEEAVWSAGKWWHGERWQWSLCVVWTSPHVATATGDEHL